MNNMSNKRLFAVSVLVAVLIWLYVYWTENRETVIQIPVTIVEEREGTMVEADPAVVSVRVVGPQSLILKADGAGLSIDLNVSEYPVGVSSLRLSSSDVRVAGLEVIEISPTRIQLNIEPSVREDIRVRPLIFGQPEYGYKLVGVKSDPENVTVEGFREAITQIGSVQTNNMTITGIKENTTFETGLTWYQGVRSIEPDMVTVTVLVEEDIITRNILGTRLLCRQNTGNSAVERNLPQADVVIQGRRDIVEAVNANQNFAEVDCTAVNTEEGSILPVEPRAFANYKVISVTPEQVEM